MALTTEDPQLRKKKMVNSASISVSVRITLAMMKHRNQMQLGGKKVDTTYWNNVLAYFYGKKQILAEYLIPQDI